MPTKAKPKKVAPTMSDVGKVAGVSQSVVSRVLSNKGAGVRIPPATRERVRIAARELGFRPNPLARGLRGWQTMLLGVVVSDMSDPFFAEAIEALAIASRARDYNLVLGHAHDRLDEAITVAHVLEARHCDAIILLGDIQDQSQLFADLGQSVTPIVGLLQGSSGSDMPLVGVDNVHGIEAAVGHLWSLGHRRIALVSGQRTGDILERHDAFLDAMQVRGIAHPQVEYDVNTPTGGDQAAMSLLSGDSPPSAIVCSTDTMAIGALHAAHTLGVRVPRDLSVIGFDDMPLARHLTPELTSVRMPLVEMATEAVRIAIALATDPAEEPGAGLRLFQPTLVIRSSTARAS